MTLGEEDIEGDSWGGACHPVPTTEVRISNEGGGSFQVMAFAFGDWAIHRSVHRVGGQPMDPKLWSVSHIPSGHNIGVAVDLQFWDAYRIAIVLDDACASVAFDVDDVSLDDAWLVLESAIGAALHDHYVWPMSSHTWKPDA